jgi:uncharacterized RDD family membrane protein YckC
MEDTISIRTPENVEISCRLAGYGTRFLAMMVDYLIIISLLIGLSITVWILRILFLPVSLFVGTGPMGLAMGFWILGFFIIVWGYFIGFEAKWGGQTPGKRLFGIRTRNDFGGGITFFQATIRNLLRTIDILPFGYFVGGMVMLCNARQKRLGDLVAGTIVIKEKKLDLPSPSPIIYNGENPLAQDPIMRKGIKERMRKEEKELLFELLRRANRIEFRERMKLMEEFSDHLSRRLNIEKPHYLSTERFLHQIADAITETKSPPLQQERQRPQPPLDRTGSQNPPSTL